jgi:hypothetical protein
MDSDVMTAHSPQPSWRKPAGAFLIIAMIAGWAVLVSSALDYLPGLPFVIELLIYAIAGIVWIIPARAIVVWMETGRWRISAD